MSLTDREILKAIKSSALAGSAADTFYNHAFCILVGMLDIDQNKLVEKISFLSPKGDEFFQKIYNLSKEQLIQNLEGLSKE